MARMAVSLFCDETTDYSKFSDELLRGWEDDYDDAGCLAGVRGPEKWRNETT